MDPVMRQKVENDAAAGLRSMVAKRGRNSALAEKAVREAKSFTEKEALDAKSDRSGGRATRPSCWRSWTAARSRASTGASRSLHTAGAEVVEYQPSLREKIFIGVERSQHRVRAAGARALGIYVEFTSRADRAGRDRRDRVLLGLSAICVLPINWLGVALLLLAVALFVLEAKFTSHGVLGVGGAVAMVLGAVMLVESPPEMRIRLGTALAVALPFAAITVFLATLAIRARANKVVTGPGGDDRSDRRGANAAGARRQGFRHGEYWNAVSTPSGGGGRQGARRLVRGFHAEGRTG